MAIAPLAIYTFSIVGGHDRAGMALPPFSRAAGPLAGRAGPLRDNLTELLQSPCAELLLPGE
jgi:hypothetical protein